MKTNKALLLYLFMSFGCLAYCQSKRIAAIEVSAITGFSNDLGSKNIHAAFSSFEKIQLGKKSFAKSQDISFAFTRYINPKNGIKISCGYVQLGFDYIGVFEVSQNRVYGTYLAKYTDWGISYVRRIPISTLASLILEPGFNFHSNGTNLNNNINLYEVDAFSFSTYTGLEIPMLGNNFFTTVGMQLKFPLERYNSQFDTPYGYYPLLLGLRIGINFQF